MKSRTRANAKTATNGHMPQLVGGGGGRLVPQDQLRLNASGDSTCIVWIKGIPVLPRVRFLIHFVACDAKLHVPSDNHSVSVFTLL